MRRILPIAALTVLMCVSCSGGVPQGAPAMSRSVTLMTVAPVPLVPPTGIARQCGAGYQEWPMVPETRLEAMLADSMRVCYDVTTDLANQPAYAIQVINAGPAVWVAEGFGPWGSQSRNSGPLTLQLFRNAIAPVADRAVEPGQEAFAILPISYVPRVYLDAALQAQWEVISQSVDAGTSRLTEAAWKQTGPHFRAGVECGMAAYNIGDQLAGAPSDDGAYGLDQIFTGASEAWQCRQAIEKSKLAAQQEGLKAPPLAVEDLKVTAIADQAHVSSAQRTLNAALRNLSRLARVLPR